MTARTPGRRVEQLSVFSTQGGGGQVGAVAGQTWCPGTYHLSVAIMGRREARAFGTAMYTVKR